MKMDIVIVGAGPAGLSFASSLESTGLRCWWLKNVPVQLSPIRPLMVVTSR